MDPRLIVDAVAAQLVAVFVAGLVISCAIGAGLMWLAMHAG